MSNKRYNYIGYVLLNNIEDENNNENDYVLKIENVYVDSYGSFGFSTYDLDKAIENSSIKSQYVIANIKEYIDDNYWSTDDWYWYDPLTVSQCTDICDKNDNYIYENDYLNEEDNYVKYYNGSYVLSKTGELLSDVAHNSIIVGNTFQGIVNTDYVNRYNHDKDDGVIYGENE